MRTGLAWIRRTAPIFVLSALALGAVPTPVQAAEPLDSQPLVKVADIDSDDVVVFGGDRTVGPDENVSDVVVFGGNVTVQGHVQGDLVLIGGHVDVLEGAEVDGEVVSLGGSMQVHSGAHVAPGKVDPTAAGLRDPSAAVPLAFVGEGRDIEATAPRSKWATALDLVERGGARFHAAASAVVALFLLGIPLIALLEQRMKRLQLAAATSPGRVLALGVVGMLACFTVSIALTVTVIGLPIALAFGAAWVVALLAGMTAVLTTAGGALVGHRIESSYAHFGVGCAIFGLCCAVPYLGSMVVATVATVGMGTVIATRGAGLFDRSTTPNVHPYRSPAA